MPYRIGFGTDIHKLAPGDGFKLGGVRVEADRSAVAASDGDALLHALVDALLGAAGLGDIGERYPESAAAAGESSERYVLEVAAELRRRGFEIVNTDLVIDLERPKLAGLKPVLRDSIARLLGVDAGRVNVKAKTGEGMGWVGNGDAVGAQAAVLLKSSGFSDSSRQAQGVSAGHRPQRGGRPIPSR